MENAAGAIRYALRQFWFSRVFTAAAVLTLALGIGGTTAIFTLIHAVMLRSLPVADPASLYRIGDGDNCCVQGGPQDRWGMFSFPLYERLKAETPEFEEVAAFQAGGPRLSVRRQDADVAARPLRSEYVTGNYFSTLGIGAFGGRVFTPDDDKPSAPPVAVLSHHVWQGTYGGDASVVGSTLVIEGHPFTAIGVAPPGFFGETLRGNPPDLWIPLQQEPLISGDGTMLRQPVAAWLRVIGRLRPGASTEVMGPRLTGILRQWMQHDSGYPSNWMPDVVRMLPKQVINVVPAGAGVGVMKEEYGRSLQILMAVCGLVLLIACANVANLLLARAVARRGQTAVRLAVGASRLQIVTQALVESVLLAVAGGIAGLLVAMGAARLLLALAFTNVQFLPISTRPSPLVLAFAFGLALVTGIVFGAAPAWFATRTDPIDALRGSGRSTGDHSSLARKALLIVQATLSVVLVAGATMLARSLSKLERQDFGYEVQGRVLVSLNRPPASYTQPKLAALYRELEARLNRLPGVQGSGLALYNPLTDNWGELILVAGHPPPKMAEQAGASWDRVSASYLQNFGMTMLRGRAFTAADNETTAPVAIVNEAFVKRFFKSDEDPLAQQFGLDLPENAGTFRIVGVVRDAKFAGGGLNRPARPMFYVPLAQHVDYKDEMMKRLELRSHFIGGIMLVTNASPGAIEPLVTRTLSEVDPNLTIISVRTMQQQVELSFNQERAVASLAGLFGIVALLLAAVGLYGVTAYTVAQRTNEIGIRMALGADRAKVIDLVLRGAFKRVVIGLILGLPLAVGAGRLISSQLYGVSFWDPLALAIAAVSLGTCAFVAALIPAGRAASISPMRALRTE
ncbi:MAG: ABC transporter substrate-binding protein [Acidobacteria bacterium 13_1_20CM_2_65_9]|nr:MAG: ABC transporter substrate-binding protein [Acidobacteria bacterium 13_1_20CM_2_65_9]